MYEIKSNYRRDIDGLRGISILAVIIYHYFERWMPGGYAGVDIFFVISGYLIASLTLRRLESKNFSLIDFYTRRILRIAPALLVLLILVYITGYIFFTTEYFQNLNQSIFSSLGFSQNLNLYFSANNYFQRENISLPLLPLWSLAIEEQFYLLFPIIIILLCKLQWNSLKFFTWVFFISLLANVYYAQVDQAGSYYLPQARFWEITVGILLAHIEHFHKLKIDHFLQKIFGKYSIDILTCLAVILVASSFWGLRTGVLWYGLWAIPPVLATALCIWAGSKAFLSRIFLCSKPLVFIGKISYPLYLYHWALLSMTRSITTEYPGRKEALLLIAISFVLSWLTHVLVEKKTNNHKRPYIKAITIIVLSMTLFVISFASYRADGIPERSLLKYLPQTLRPSPVAQKLAHSTVNDRDYRCNRNAKTHAKSNISYCEFGKGPYKVLVTGDSHAIPLYRLFEALGNDPDLNVHFYLSFVRFGNPLGKSAALGRESSEAPVYSPYFAKLYEDTTRLGINEVFVTANWGYFMHKESYPNSESIRQDILKNTAVFRTQGTSLSILLDSPRPRSMKIDYPLDKHEDYLGLFRKIGANEIQIEDIYTTSEEYQNQHLAVKNIFYQLETEYLQEIQVIDPTPSYCSEGRCPGIDEVNLHSYNYDGGHQTKYGTMRLYKQIKEHFMQVGN